MNDSMILLKESIVKLLEGKVGSAYYSTCRVNIGVKTLSQDILPLFLSDPMSIPGTTSKQPWLIRAYTVFILLPQQKARYNRNENLSLKRGRSATLLKKSISSRTLSVSWVPFLSVILSTHL